MLIEESRQIEQVRDPVNDKITEIKPVEGTHKAFLTLKTPEGATFKAEINPATLVTHIAPNLT